jgi:hypothetical protein
LLGSVVSALTGGRQQAGGGLAAIANLIDMDGDGNPLNDIMKLMNR